MSDIYNNYVFIDTETTGLDIGVNDMLEVSWAIGEDGVVKTLVISYREFAKIIANEWYDENAMRINGYDKYITDGPDGSEVNGYSLITTNEVNAAAQVLYDDLRGKTLVGANPAFDAKFLAKFFEHRDLTYTDVDGTEVYRQYHDGFEPWHYRLYDVQAVFGGWVYGASLEIETPYGYIVPDVPPLMGLRDIARWFQKKGYDIPHQGDVHSSANDVDITRKIFFAMLDYRG